MTSFKFKQFFFDWIYLLTRGCSFALRDPKNAILLLRMAAWVLIISGLVKVLSLPRVLSIITPRDQSELREPEPAPSNLRIVQVMDQLLSLNLLVFTPTCWKRAMVLYRYLALNGIKTRIVFGISKGGNGFLDGHAWLEADGKPFLESKKPEFTVTYSFPT
jgi:hypothetical protein